MQCSRLQEQLAESALQRRGLDEVITDLRLDLQRAQEAVGRLIPDQQQQRQQQQENSRRERELENEIEMLKIQLVMQQQRCAAELHSSRSNFDASLAYLESRTRSTIARLAEAVKV